MYPPIGRAAVDTPCCGEQAAMIESRPTNLRTSATVASFRAFPKDYWRPSRSSLRLRAATVAKGSSVSARIAVVPVAVS
jgi:hypothetical protein